MSKQLKSTWQVKRNKAIERFVSAIENSEETDDGEEQNMALDAMTVAHLSAAFEIEGGAAERWQKYKANAIERFFAVWEKYDGTEEDPEVLDELNAALDLLALAHIATTFEFASGPLKW